MFCKRIEAGRERRTTVNIKVDVCKNPRIRGTSTSFLPEDVSNNILWIGTCHDLARCGAPTALVSADAGWAGEMLREPGGDNYSEML